MNADISPPIDPPQHPPLRAAWRWRYRDPASGELINHSELLTTDQVRAIDPHAELIPGSRVQPRPARPGRFALR